MTLIFHNCHLNIIMIWWSDLADSSDDSITIFEDKLRHYVWVVIMNHYRLRELPFDSFIVPNTIRLYHCKLIYCRNIFCDIYIMLSNFTLGQTYKKMWKTMVSRSKKCSNSWWLFHIYVVAYLVMIIWCDMYY